MGARSRRHGQRPPRRPRASDTGGACADRRAARRARRYRETGTLRRLRQDHGRSGRGGAGPGLGYIAEFDLDGRHLRTLGHTRRLNAPWGMAVAPEDFGPFSKRLLVGNFGDGTLVAFWLKKRAAERIFTRPRSAGHPDRWPLGPRLRQRREARTCELPVIHRRAEGRGRWPLRQPALYG
ncbi:MAG: TIGR03118 family protein [Gammaproteobacteria bacterium]